MYSNATTAQVAIRCILVAHGATRTLNPSLPQRVVDRALEKDRARATAEYLAQFRTDVEGFVAPEIVEGCTGDYREMLPAANNFYRAFTDPSGGSDDSFALAISHKSEDRIIIDAIREARPPFSPHAVVDDFAALLKSYRVSRVTGVPLSQDPASRERPCRGRRRRRAAFA